MNNPLFNHIDFDDEFPRTFCHHEEMKNFSTYLYLKLQGLLTGKINVTDPCEDNIIAISPKVFCLLMLTNHDQLFCPVSTDENIGIVLQWQCAFGRVCVYSQDGKSWADPWSGSGHIALNFLFEHIKASAVDQIRAKFPDLQWVIEPESGAVNVKMDCQLSDGSCLEDLSGLIDRWLNRLFAVEKLVNSQNDQH